MKSYPTKFKSFLWKIVQMGTLQKLQNSIQTLLIFWPVYPIHTNSLFWVIFVELLFCHFPPPNTSIRGKDSKMQLIFHLNILVFQTNGKQPYSFPVLSRFCNGLQLVSKTSVLKRFANYAGVCLLCMARVNFKSILGVLTGMMNPQELLSYLRFRTLCKSHSKASHSSLLCNFSVYSLLYFLYNVTVAIHPVPVKQHARSEFFCLCLFKLQIILLF